MSKIFGIYKYQKVLAYIYILTLKAPCGKVKYVFPASNYVNFIIIDNSIKVIQTTIINQIIKFFIILLEVFNIIAVKFNVFKLLFKIFILNETTYECLKFNRNNCICRSPIYQIILIIILLI